MIFVTVGTQHPYDRLVLTVDHWAATRGHTGVFAQIGVGAQMPSHLEWSYMLSPAEIAQRVRDADIVVAHAGIGTILTALNAGTPVIIMPRREDMKETRGGHQLATARLLSDRPGIVVADDESALPLVLDRVAADHSPAPDLSPFASEELLNAIRNFIGQGS